MDKYNTMMCGQSSYFAVLVHFQILANETDGNYLIYLALTF